MNQHTTDGLDDTGENNQELELILTIMKINNLYLLSYFITFTHIKRYIFTC